MKRYLHKFSSMLVLGLSLILIQGCKDNEQINVNRVFEQTKMSQTNADYNFKKLEEHVGSASKKGKYEMAMLVALSQVEKEFPDNEAIKDMSKQFKLDTTKNGEIWKTIEADYKAVKAKPENKLLESTAENAPKNKLGALTNLYNGYQSFNTAHTTSRFDERFIDYINTLAAISKNVSPVIVETLDSNAPVGSSFVGNPQYGQWVDDGNGNQMWSFFETYLYLSFLDNVLFDRNYGYGYSDYRRNYGSYGSVYYSGSRSSSYKYDNWRNTRNYSYYNDVYVDKYAKSSERKKYKASQSNLTKKYEKTIKKDNNVVKQNKTIKSSNKAFQSNLVKPKTVSATGGKNTGASPNKASQSNLLKNKSLKNSGSRKVGRSSGK